MFWQPKNFNGVYHSTTTVREALAGLEVDGGADGPKVDADWGEPGLTPAERVFGWNALEVLAFRTGNPEHPVNAIPPRASRRRARWRRPAARC